MIRLCKECDNEIPKSRRKDSHFCNTKCRNRHWMRLHPRVKGRKKKPGIKWKPYNR